MTIRYAEEYRDPNLSRNIAEQIRKISKKRIRLMEVCGTHTMSIFRNGIRSLLPDTISLLSGPGCPVCVTAQNEIDRFIEISKKENVIVTTFGDLMRVPGSNSSLQKEKADGKDIRMVYSVSDAVETAKNNPDKQVVFLGVGFETTAPTVAASLITAKEMNLNNYFVCSAHKLVPPALSALMNMNHQIDGFILPGHVSVIIGKNAYLPFFEQYQIPCAIAGFEPADILQAVLMLVKQIEADTPLLENGYQRGVTPEGNLKAKKIMAEVFDTADAGWRGLGIIHASGLKLRKEFKENEFLLSDDENKCKYPLFSENSKGCACGEILIGLKTPPECPLYKKLCTPMNPIGPCMVSSEGTCAAYYKYHN